MTRKDIVCAIKEMENVTLNDKTASILADLLYIERHWHRTDGAHEMADMMMEPEEEHGMSAAMAEAWCEHMENVDGTVGPHWSRERIQQELAQRGICYDPVVFWAVINSIYSDDVAVAKKHGVNTMDYYIDRAKAWLDDKDAVRDKATAYYQYVVRHDG